MRNDEPVNSVEITADAKGELPIKCKLVGDDMRRFLRVMSGAGTALLCSVIRLE